MKFTVFSFKNLNQPGGSMIRIIGYSYFLKDNRIDVDFYNPYDIPKVLKEKVNHQKFKVSKSLFKLLEYYCTFPKFLYFFKYIINLYPFIKKIGKINNPIIFHQNFLLGLFLTITKKKNCIYDIHGIIELQKEYLINSSLMNKIKFFHKLLIERNYFKYGQFFIVISKEMKYLLIKSYNVNPKNIFLAEEGLLDFYRNEINTELAEIIKTKYNISHDNKIILFAGDFKNFGGVWDLVRAFYIIQKKNSKCKLFLIGTGQEENKIKKFIKKKNLNNKIILFGLINYKYLSTYQNIADLIVCPDSKNLYNEITPHIKVFDSLASGKPLVLAKFQCLYELIKNFRGIELFEPGNIENLTEKILKILNYYNKYSIEAIYNKIKIKDYTYEKNTKFLIRQITKRLLLKT